MRQEALAPSLTLASQDLASKMVADVGAERAGGAASPVLREYAAESRATRKTGSREEKRTRAIEAGILPAMCVS